MFLVGKPTNQITIELSNNIPELGTPSGIRDLTLEGESVRELDVRKYGASTKQQEGKIRNIHISTSLVYHQLPGDPSVDFIELVEYDALSEGGDSGAAVVDTSDPPKVVGMHVAGKLDHSGSFFTHIRYVFDYMNIELLSSLSD